jgi:hypothetical protein
MFPEQAHGSRLSRQHDPLRPVAPDQVRDGLGDSVVVMAALLLDAALIMAPAIVTVRGPVPSLDVRVERHLLAGALRRERQNPGVNAIDEDDEGWYDLVQYRSERPQVWTSVHDEGVGKRGSDGQHRSPSPPANSTTPLASGTSAVLVSL